MKIPALFISRRKKFVTKFHIAINSDAPLCCWLTSFVVATTADAVASGETLSSDDSHLVADQF